MPPECNPQHHTKPNKSQPTPAFSLSLETPHSTNPHTTTLHLTRFHSHSTSICGAFHHLVCHPTAILCYKLELELELVRPSSTTSTTTSTTMCEVRIQYARQYFDCRHYGGAAKYRIAARCFKPTRRCSVNGGSGGDGGGYGGYNKPGTGGGAGGAVSCYSHEKVEGARSLLPGLCPECKAAASVKILRGRGMDEQKLVVVEREAERWHGEVSCYTRREAFSRFLGGLRLRLECGMWACWADRVCCAARWCVCILRFITVDHNRKYRVAFLTGSGTWWVRRRRLAPARRSPRPTVTIAMRIKMKMRMNPRVYWLDWGRRRRRRVLFDVGWMGGVRLLKGWNLNCGVTTYISN